MTIDERLEKYCGFIKLDESVHGAEYLKINAEFNYRHKVGIYRKASGKHLIISYDPDNMQLLHQDNIRYVHVPAVGLTYVESKLFCKKLKELRRKYNW